MKVHNVTALLSMEEIKSTAQVPLGDINFSEIRLVRTDHENDIGLSKVGHLLA